MLELKTLVITSTVTTEHPLAPRLFLYRRFNLLRNDDRFPASRVRIAVLIARNETGRTQLWVRIS